MSLWQRWVALMDERESPLRLAQIRICLGLVLLCDLFWVHHYGLVELLWAPHPQGGLGLTSTWESPPLAYALGGANVFFWLSVASTMTFTLGLLTRTSTAILLLSYAQLGAMMPTSDRGIDMLFRAVLLILLFSRCGHALSLDARIKERPVLAPAWPRYLIVLQLAWTYFSAGVHKTQSAWWPAGSYEALWRVLHDPHFARFDFAEFLTIPGASLFTQLATAATMLFELGAPLFLLSLHYRRTAERHGRVRRAFNALRVREIWIALGVIFHLGLLFTLRLGIFPLGMLALYPAFFSPRRRRAS